MAKTSVKAGRTKSAATGFIILILVFAAAALVIKTAQSPSKPSYVEAAPASSAAGVVQPQPPGPVPEGKVWSPEHGHWHDIQAGDSPSPQVGPISTPAPRTFTPAPQPPGPAPDGKEWSIEHGHWHNIPGYIDSKTEIKNSMEQDFSPVETSIDVELPDEPEAAEKTESGVDPE